MTKILGLAVVLLAASCGGDRGSNEQMLRQIGQTACEKRWACYPSNPGYASIDACVNAFVNAFPAGRLAESAVCSDDEVAACRNDLTSFACTELAAGRIPSSCGKCVQ